MGLDSGCAIIFRDSNPCCLQVAAVERFVVVHAGIILNQFAHFPVKTVQRSAFHGSLREAQQTKRHHKLFTATKPPARGINRNPIKVSLLYDAQQMKRHHKLFAATKAPARGVNRTRSR